MRLKASGVCISPDIDSCLIRGGAIVLLWLLFVYYIAKGGKLVSKAEASRNDDDH